MAEMHGRFGGGCTGPCREMVLVARSLLQYTRFSFDSLARAKNGQHSWALGQAKISTIVLKCIE